jgi:hypothetical protein
MEKKQTAVQFMNDEILVHLNFDQRLYLKEIFKQSLQMEREQIEEAYEVGDKYKTEISGEQYYNKTFKP